MLAYNQIDTGLKWVQQLLVVSIVFNLIAVIVAVTISANIFNGINKIHTETMQRMDAITEQLQICETAEPPTRHELREEFKTGICGNYNYFNLEGSEL